MSGLPVWECRPLMALPSLTRHAGHVRNQLNEREFWKVGRAGRVGYLAEPDGRNCMPLVYLRYYGLGQRPTMNREPNNDGRAKHHSGVFPTNMERPYGHPRLPGHCDISIFKYAHQPTK